MSDGRAPGPQQVCTRVLDAVSALDGGEVREALVSFASDWGVDAVVVEVMIPVLRAVGEAWSTGRLGVVHEHFLSTTFQGLLGEFRPVGVGTPVRSVVLACLPGELHDLPLELFGSLLQRRSWRVVSLGADTPMEALADAVHMVRADACVVAGVRAEVFQHRVPALAHLAGDVPVFLGGAGALALGRSVPGCALLPADLARAADVLDTA
ncbi:MAG: cobalamin B12-binding domain-containing protein [Dermatophilaceae bacterium]